MKGFSGNVLVFGYLLGVYWLLAIGQKPSAKS